MQQILRVPSSRRLSRRTSVKHSGAAFETGPAFNKYGYNMRSEVTNANRYWGSDLGNLSDPVSGQSFGYAYDNIGNRLTSTKNEEQGTYSANVLNQYTQRTVPDAADIIGSAFTNTTVKVNNEPANRHNKYWHKALTVTNSASAAYPSVEVIGIDTNSTTNILYAIVTGNVFIAKTPEIYTYDDDGNLLSDGRFNYSWDAENRLISAETLTNLPASVPRVKVEIAYDYMSRRVGKTVSSWNSSSNEYQVSSINGFVYDSWNLIQEIADTPSLTYTNTYTWGLDLSGTIQGAGGIGGLLAAQLGTNSVVYCYDGNGNVSELVSASGAVVGHYEYSPFGETIVATGPLADDNPFRFSTKYLVVQLAMGDWGRRWYIFSLGRWASEDPIEDGENKYAYVRNCVIDFIDILGLQYDYSIYLGVGPDGGNELIQKAAAMAEKRKKEYTPPKGADKKCRFTVENRISSTQLRGATKEHDAVHFYGHGNLHRKLNPNRKPNDPSSIYIDRTALVFADGEKYLSEVLTEPKVKASYVVTWVCYDRYVDSDNPSGIPVCKPVDSATPNLSIMLMETLNQIMNSCQSKKCCTLD